ncbi:hypothetical protein SAMN06265222_11060 [Neorhodopirellula lusitana]|uniref:Uncharacterized protein n=1 Tax=Neorhodopirellula lusitana TaxID=445327 RepID=A0ABY1QBU5_9BACT|nr:hypothetical protein [Neorhodopirellula lusitana]SMP66911.1 hypothetical protein SAMN06265222_11060 [Neorhodopirellula lusitana]
MWRDFRKTKHILAAMIIAPLLDHPVIEDRGIDYYLAKMNGV